MKQLIDISFITVCYNGFDDTCELIESLKQIIHSVSYEIIVVDNASRKDEASELQTRYPDIKAIRSERNLGFAGGNNLGIREAAGKYIFLINNDTFIEEDGLSYLIERLENDVKIGAVSPKIRFAFPPRNIQFAGFTPSPMRHCVMSLSVSAVPTMETSIRHTQARTCTVPPSC